MPTATRKLIRALGSESVAYMLDEDKRNVDEWLDSSSNPDIDQLEVIVFAWDVYERLSKIMPYDEVDAWFDFTNMGAIRDGDREFVLEGVKIIEDEISNKH